MGRRAHPGSRGFTLASHWVAVVNLGAPRGRRVHSGSRGFTLARLMVVVPFGIAWVHSGAIGFVRFIQVRVGSLFRALVSRVHSGSRRFTTPSLGIVAFN